MHLGSIFREALIEWVRFYETGRSHERGRILHISSNYDCKNGNQTFRIPIPVFLVSKLQ